MSTRRTDGRMKRLSRWGMRKSPWKAYVLLVLMLISTVSTVRASGDLKNTGTINNTGQMRVQNQALGLPAVNGGEYEFFGASQTIPGRQYVDLKLSGTGTKTADADGTVTGTLTVNAGVTYDTGPFTTHLLGTLAELGYVSGAMDKTMPLTGGSGSSTFGNIGATISWTGTAPGNTLVIRKSGVVQTSSSTGKSSIKRYYDITPAMNTSLNATLVFKYADVELNGQTAGALSLWKSTDGGSSWRNQGGSVDVVQRTITKTGISSFSRWTASDAANPLGPVSVEGVAENLASSMGNGQTGMISTSLPMQLVVTSTDYYGGPVKNTAVTFAISGVPSGATGQSLSLINTVTDNLGQASTTLTLGDKVGAYTVTASSPFIAGSLVTFSETAIKPSPVSVATTFTLASGNNQTGVAYTTLPQPYAVTVADQFGTPMGGIPVKFALISSPSGAVGQKLNDTLVTTNASGQASTQLKLGTKVGDYVVTSSSGSLSGSPVTFTSKAVSASAANVTLPLGTTLSGQIGQTLGQPVVVMVTDAYGNPVSGVGVHYVLSSPAGAMGQTPQDVTILTDSLGRSQVLVTLGSKAGTYTLQVSAGSLPPQVVTIMATGGQTGTVAARLLQTSGNAQSGVVMTQLANPFVVTVVDTSGNAVRGVSVRFGLGTSPVLSSAQALTDTVVATDTNGQARTFLKLGTRVGSYAVTASSGTLLGSPVTFAATAVAGAATRLAQISGDRQTRQVSTTLAQPFVVVVTDNQQNPVSGTVINFAITATPTGASGQVLDASQRTTDSQGLASVVLTLGDKAGDYRVDATSASIGGSIVSFTGTATPSVSLARTMLLSSGQDQRGVVRSILSQPFVVRTVDANNNPVAGVSVQFAIDTIPVGATGQALSTTSATTDLLGYASTLLTLGDAVGTYTVTATSSGLAGSPLTLHAVATLANGAMRMVYTTGDAQRGVVRSILPQLFVVRTLDVNNNPVAGVSVQFEVDTIPAGASGQSLSTPSATTDVQGYASTVLTLGDKTGLYTVTASSSGLTGSPLTLHAVATLASGAVRMVYASGDLQSAAVLSQLASPLVATVLDADGRPVSGQAVAFAIDSIPSGSTGQLISPSSAVTDAQGRATANMTLGTKIGTYRVSASVAGLGGSPITYRLTSTVGLPKELAFVQGNNQTRQIATTLDNAYVVWVLDGAQNPVPGVAVNFAIDSIPNGATGQALRIINSTTDAQGQAQAVLTLGNKVGMYVVSARSPGLDGSPVVFRARAAAGSAAIVALTSGDGQTALVSSELLLPMILTVTDVGGNVVQAVSVQFALETSPSGATGQSLRVVNAQTDANGQASVYLTLGDRDGRYTVTATVTGLALVRFGATATVLVGDINGDSAVNIADLTTVIDYILGRLTLSPSDSVKADYNKDGHIDIRDVVAMQSYLLAINVVGAKPGASNPTSAKAISPNATAATLTDSTGQVSGEFVLTDNGLRFNLTNTEPVKGLQLVVRFKDPQNISGPDVVFDRAKVDSFYVNSSGRELRIVAYNMNNVPIGSGDGSLFRLPVHLTDVSGIESAQMIVSLPNNKAFFDEALTRLIPARLVKPQELPVTFVLYQNYPNPFNGQTKIDYEVTDMAGMADVSVQVYNVLGERVKTLVTARRAGGRFTERWDGTDDRGVKLSSGTYYYRLISGSFVSSKKMILLK